MIGVISKYSILIYEGADHCMKKCRLDILYGL